MSAHPRPKCQVCGRRMHEAMPTKVTPAWRRESPHGNRCTDCPPDHYACGCPESYWDIERSRRELKEAQEKARTKDVAKLCEDCGNPDGKCGNCGRMHHPAIENGRCEGCKDEPAKGAKLPPRQIRVDVIGHVVTNGVGLSAAIFNVEVSTPTGAWSEMYSTMAERDAFLQGLKAASSLLGAREPDVKSHQGRMFEFSRGGIELQPDELVMLRQGKKIDAIKALRKRTGMGLKEAKDVCDRA